MRLSDTDPSPSTRLRMTPGFNIEELLVIASLLALVRLLGLPPFAFPVQVGALHLFVIRDEIPEGIHPNRLTEDHVEIEDVSPEAVPALSIGRGNTFQERA